MSAQTESSTFRERLAAAHLRVGSAAGPSLQPSLVAPPGAASVPVADAEAARSAAADLFGFARTMLVAACAHVKTGLAVRRDAQRNRRLRVLETVALGEKRFLAIVQVRDQEFLIGSSASGVSLLTRLGAHADVSDALCEGAACRPPGVPSPEQQL